MSIKMSLKLSILGLSKKRKCCIMTHVAFVAELRHFLQYVFINWRCELSPCGFSHLPVRRMVEESLETIPPNLLSLVVLHKILVSPFFPLFHASEHREWEYAFNECSPSPVPRALFTFTNPASSLFFFFFSSLSLSVSPSFSLTVVAPIMSVCTFYQRCLWWV